MIADAKNNNNKKSCTLETNVFLFKLQVCAFLVHVLGVTFTTCNLYS